MTFEHEGCVKHMDLGFTLRVWTGANAGAGASIGDLVNLISDIDLPGTNAESTRRTQKAQPLPPL